MEVDAGFAKTGLKSVSKLHSSTFLDGKVVIDGGKLARIDLNMPRDTMEILEATADFYTWQVAEDGRRVYLPLESDNQQEVFVGCSSEGNDLFGVELCGVAKYHYVPDNELVIVNLFLDLNSLLVSSLLLLYLNRILSDCLVCRFFLFLLLCWTVESN